MTQYKAYDKKDGWTEADIALHKATDWKARNFEKLPTGDRILAPITIYRMGQRPEIRVVEMERFIEPNPIYPPRYQPTEEVKGACGPMYDGHARNGYDVLDRYEDQATYDFLTA